MPRLLRTTLVTLAVGLSFFVAFLLNVDYIKKTFFPTQFTFGKAEMMSTLGVVNQTRSWSFRCGANQCSVELALSPTPGVDTTRHVTEVDHPLTSQAHACGSRSFFQTASACYDTTTLAVLGTVTIRERTSPTVLFQSDANGELTALGTSLSQARLILRVAGGVLEMYSHDAKHFELLTVWVPAKQLGTREFKFSR